VTILITTKLPTTQDLDLKIKEVASPSTMALIGFTVNGATATATYVYNSGAAADAVRLVLQRTVDKAGISHNSARLFANVVWEDSVSGETRVHPVDFGLVWNYPQIEGDPTTNLVELMQALVGFFAQTLTGANGYPNGAEFGAFDRGVLTQFVG
jgi:hypothetical protein